MLRSLSIILLGASLFTMSSCCCTERGPHAVRKAWLDYNTLRYPAIYLEQEDHLPYPAAQVAYYRWMYDKDPGHQLACLGPIPPRTCPSCDPVPPGNDPFEYEVYFPAGIPKQSDQLWGNKLPEPVNVPGATMHAEGSPDPGMLHGSSSTTKAPAPLLPPAPSPVAEPKATADPSVRSEGNSPNELRTPKPPVRLPTFEVPPPPPKPLEEIPAPLIGPAAQQGPNLRLTNGQPISYSEESGPSPDSVWPR
jgi:hypothetical protein